MRILFGRAVAALGLAASLAASAAPAAAQGEVNVYSYRQPFLVEPLFEAFTRETGIEVNVIYSSEGLVERMKQEGANSPADLLLTVDIGRLTNAVAEGVTQPVDSDVLTENIPAQFRDPEGHWFGLTARGRVIYASNERVDQDTITYEELADPKWRGRICTRSGQHVYSVALIASMIAHHGEAETKKWLEGVKANLAHKPSGGDREQVRAIYNGECDIALGNTYYMALMRTNDKEPEQKEWAAASRILFPNAGGRGTHVNISGMVLAKHAPNRDNAVKLMEWLSSDEAQRIYAEVNHEYPVEPGIGLSEMVASFGEIKPDALPLAEIAKHRKRASELVDETGFDEGPTS